MWVVYKMWQEDIRFGMFKVRSRVRVNNREEGKDSNRGEQWNQECDQYRIIGESIYRDVRRRMD